MLKFITRIAHNNLVYRRRTEILAARIGELIPNAATVLDVGTGDGRIASLLKSQRPDVQVEGLDVLLRNQTCIPVHWFDGCSIQCNDQSVDVLTLIDVLHHSHDAKKLMAEAARVARKFVIVKDHLSENALDHATLTFMDWFGNAPHGVALRYYYFSRRTWLEMFSASGLQVTIFEGDLSLYPRPANYIFGRRMHFIAQLRPR